jgi:uncharacterized protein
MAVEAHYPSTDNWTFPIEPHVGPLPPEADPRHRTFCLVLMVTRACNMRCSYCYVGRKSARVMDEAVGRRAIDKAIASLTPGGTLELGFFGGEPMLEAERVLALVLYARRRAAEVGVGLDLGMTTNGTVFTAAARAVMTMPEVSLAISHDGLPEAHNRHRRLADGTSSCCRVLATMHRLIDAGKDFRVAMVVRPDTADWLPASVEFLGGLGVRHVDAALDLWTWWTEEDARTLDAAISRCADVWRASLPDFSMNWFDEKAALLAHLPAPPTARCAFGTAQVAVAPSGRLYPCERLIGEDTGEDPMRLPGGASEGGHFLWPTPPFPSAGCVPAWCAACRVRPYCTATCSCSNYVRTGNTLQPDGLLCLLNKSCIRETARVLANPGAGPTLDAALRPVSRSSNEGRA